MSVIQGGADQWFRRSYRAMELCRLFGLNVRRLRKEAGYSQETFADLAGVARSYMSEIEVGRQNATLKVVEKIAKALNVPASELLE